MPLILWRGLDGNNMLCSARNSQKHGGCIFLQPIFLKIKHWSPHPTLKLVNVRITDDGESSRLLRE